MNDRRPLLILLPIVMLVACSTPARDVKSPDSESGNEVTASTDSPEDPGDTTSEPDSGAATATISLTLTGGPHDGTYEADAVDAGCSRNLSGDNTFGLQYSTSETQGFTSHQLIIRDAAAAASSSDDFRTDVLIDDASYGLDSGAGVLNDPSGSGTVTLDDRGATATVTITGETADGVGFEAEIECHSVFG